MHISGISPFAASSMFMAGSMGHEAAGLENPFGDHFIGMDPMEMRHGVFAWNGQSSSGGTIRDQVKPTAQSLAQTLFPGHRAPSDGNGIAQVARHSAFSSALQDGAILAWTKNLDGESIPNVFALCELPVRHEQVFETLLDVNGLQTWMPRVMLFRSDDADAKDPAAMRKRFSRHRSLHLEGIDSRYKTTVPQFYGRFAIDYRTLNDGALQMEWNLKGIQTPPDEPKRLDLETSKEVRELKEMKTNNSSFTLIPSPERPDRTVCAYHLNAQPVYMPFVASVITLFVPGDNAKELDRLFQALLNRTIDRRWTAKDYKNPLGLDLSRAPSPTPHRFTVQKIY